jgi:hypothetical protein
VALAIQYYNKPNLQIHGDDYILPKIINKLLNKPQNQHFIIISCLSYNVNNKVSCLSYFQKGKEIYWIWWVWYAQFSPVCKVQRNRSLVNTTPIPCGRVCGYIIFYLGRMYSRQDMQIDCRWISYSSKKARHVADVYTEPSNTISGGISDSIL